MTFADARELFDAAREAARDAERIGRQLDAMDARARSLGGGGFDARVRGTRDPDRIGTDTAVRLDHADMLERRREDDLRLMDAACSVLYGEHGDGGLWALVGWRADALYHHYLALRTWDEVGAMLGYSAEHACRESMAALDVADAWGMARTVAGMGGAT